MDSSDVRFPWEDPDDTAAPAASDDPAPIGESAPLAGAPHTEVDPARGTAGTDDVDPWSVGATAGSADDGSDPWSPTGADVAAAPAPEGTSEAAPASAPSEAGGARDRPIAQKEYYSISEVCDLVDLKPHVLRYWETQFAVLNPSKNRSGNRVYQRKEIKLIQLVKHLLYDEKYTVEGAKQKLEQLRRGGELPAATGRALDGQTIDMLRVELRKLSELLSPPEPA